MSMLEGLLRIWQDGWFWAHVLAGCLVWWAVTCGLARVLYNVRVEALRAACLACWWGLLVAMILVAVYAWFRWHDPLTLLALDLTILVLCSVINLVFARSEPAYQG